MTVRRSSSFSIGNQTAQSVSIDGLVRSVGSRYFNAFANQWNVVTGGTISTFTSTGQVGTEIGGVYRVHTFSATTTCTVVSSAMPFDVLLVAGGGGGGDPTGNVAQGTSGGGGGGGGVLRLLAQYVEPGTYTVTVGLGGGTQGFGGFSRFGLWTALGGGNGGGSINLNGGGSGGGGGGQAGFGGSSGVGPTGGPGSGTALQGHNGSGNNVTTGGAGGGAGPEETSTTHTQAGRTLDFTGTAYTYSYGGGSPGAAQYGTFGSGGYGARNLDGNNNTRGGPGTGGIAYLRYRIG